MKKEKQKRKKNISQGTTRSRGRTGAREGARGEMGDKVIINGMGEVIVSLKVREEKGKFKEKPAGLEEGENMQEELGHEISLERQVVLG